MRTSQSRLKPGNVCAPGHQGREIKTGDRISQQYPLVMTFLCAISAKARKMLLTEKTAALSRRECTNFTSLNRSHYCYREMAQTPVAFSSPRKGQTETDSIRIHYREKIYIFEVFIPRWVHLHKCVVHTMAASHQWPTTSFAH